MEEQYIKLLKKISNEGHERMTRNGTVQSLFGAHLECDLSDGFPLLTTKKMYWKGIVEELAWFLRGSTNVKELIAKGVHIWDANSEKSNYDAGPVYGFQWRHFGAKYENCNTNYNGKGIDQIQYIIDTIKSDPHSRRLVLSGWCPSQMAQMCLPPCHVMYQFYVEHDNRLSVQMTQRSSDVFLGLPFNIASTALLLSIISKEVNLTPGRVIINIGDAHIYEEHKQAVQTQCQRIPLKMPTIDIMVTNLWDFDTSNIKLHGYQHKGTIKAQMKA